MLSRATLAIKKGNTNAFERFGPVAKGISEGSPSDKWFGLQMVVETMMQLGRSSRYSRTSNSSPARTETPYAIKVKRAQSRDQNNVITLRMGMPGPG